MSPVPWLMPRARRGPRRTRIKEGGDRPGDRSCPVRGRVIAGTVRRSGDRLRVTVQLSSAADGFDLWSHEYESRSADVLRCRMSLSGRSYRSWSPGFAGARRQASPEVSEAPSTPASTSTISRVATSGVGGVLRGWSGRAFGDGARAQPQAARAARHRGQPRMQPGIRPSSRAAKLSGADAAVRHQNM